MSRIKQTVCIILAAAIGYAAAKRQSDPRDTQTNTRPPTDRTRPTATSPVESDFAPKTLYLRPATAESLETGIEDLRLENDDMRSQPTREIHDALVATSLRHPDEVIDAVDADA